MRNSPRTKPSIVMPLIALLACGAAQATAGQRPAVEVTAGEKLHDDAVPASADEEDERSAGLVKAIAVASGAAFGGAVVSSALAAGALGFAAWTAMSRYSAAVSRAKGPSYPQLRLAAAGLAFLAAGLTPSAVVAGLLWWADAGPVTIVVSSLAAGLVVVVGFPIAAFVAVEHSMSVLGMGWGAALPFTIGGAALGVAGLAAAAAGGAAVVGHYADRGLDDAWSE